MRDSLAHRGPDGAGLWEGEQIALAHRRLAVVDTSNAAAQPFVDAQGRGVLSYNGELYNDAELRTELAGDGWDFRTRSDTETVLAALVLWGPAAIGRFRGMFALAFFDLVEKKLLLARDPLGIKPLYVWQGGDRAVGHLAFSSEVPALFMHPMIRASPDYVVLCSYLTTIRTTLGARTLFDGVRTLLPGDVLSFDLTRSGLPVTRSIPRSPSQAPSGGATEERTRDVIEDSLTRHLRSDVPICCLLSGGLDSAILATLAQERLGELWTYCSGAKAHDGLQEGDFAFAELMARRIRSRHAEAPVSLEMFCERWAELVGHVGLPLSTPNEIAINEVARRMRADGKVVTISGEGADELFGGYDIPLRSTIGYARAGGADPATHVLNDAAWIPRQLKPGLLRESAMARDADEHLVLWYQDEWKRLEVAGQPTETHLRMMRSVNLEGLLRRLDSSTMQASVEGRTPFADVIVMAFAEGLSARSKFDGHETKIALRRAFARVLPPLVVSRAKASFPLPIQEWMRPMASVLQESGFARGLFREEAISQVVSALRGTNGAAGSSGDVWRFAWPMLNVAMWGMRWWG